MIKEKITFPNQAAYEEFFKDYLPDIPCRYIVVIESLTAEDDTEVKNVVFTSDNNNPEKKSEIDGASAVEAVFSQAEVIAEQEETIAYQAAAIEDYQAENVVSKTEYDTLQDIVDEATTISVSTLEGEEEEINPEV